MVVQRRTAPNKPLDPPSSFEEYGSSPPPAQFGRYNASSGGSNNPPPYDPKLHTTARGKGTSMWRRLGVAVLVLTCAWMLMSRRMSLPEGYKSVRRNFFLHSSSSSSDSGDGQSRYQPPSGVVRIMFQNLGRGVVPSTDPIQIGTYVPGRPRVMAVYFDSAESSTFDGLEDLDPNTDVGADSHQHHHGIEAPHDRYEYEGFPETEEQREFQRTTIKNSKKYNKALPDPMTTEKCKPQYEWQESYRPSCNNVLEQDMTVIFDPPKPHQEHVYPVKFLAAGYYRDVWRIQAPLPRQKGDEYESRAVMKTLRYVHEYTKRNFDRHRRDALAMEQLTKSPFIMDIYAFCANSGLFEFADGGAMDDAVEDEEEFSKWTYKEKMIVGHQAASGLAAVHNANKEGFPSIAHTDIALNQFVLVNKDGVYKLNDFNRARLILEDKETRELCTFFVSQNKGAFRSPEEYTEPHVETAMVDVFSLGNVLYTLLLGEYPFEELDDEDAIKLVAAGKRANFSSAILASEDPYVQGMIKAIHMCWVQDPAERSSAREVQHSLDISLRTLGVKAKELH